MDDHDPFFKKVTKVQPTTKMTDYKNTFQLQTLKYKKSFLRLKLAITIMRRPAFEFGKQLTLQRS